MYSSAWSRYLTRNGWPLAKGCRASAMTRPLLAESA